MTRSFGLNDGKPPAFKWEEGSPSQSNAECDPETEIALGSKTLRAIGSALGQEVSIPVGGRVFRLRVVGRTVIPDTGLAGTGLGEGAVKGSITRIAFTPPTGAHGSPA